MRKEVHTRTNCLIVFPPTTYDWQPEHKHVYDGSQKGWKSKEVESLTDSKSSSPFWQECTRRRRKKKSRERRDVRWKQCQLRAECIDYSENESRSSHELGGAGGHMTHAKHTEQVLTDQTKARQKKKKNTFPPIEYVSVLHFKVPTTRFPVTANLAINSLRAKLHGGLAEEPSANVQRSGDFSKSTLFNIRLDAVSAI